MRSFGGKVTQNIVKSKSLNITAAVIMMMIIKTWGRFWRYNDIGKNKVSNCAQSKDTGESYQRWGPAMKNILECKNVSFYTYEYDDSHSQCSLFVTYCDDRSHLHKIRMNPRFTIIIFFKTCVGEDSGGGHCRGGKRRSSKWFSSSWNNIYLIFDSMPLLFKILFQMYFIFFLQFKTFTCTCLERFHCSRTS